MGILSILTFVVAGVLFLFVLVPVLSGGALFQPSRDEVVRKIIVLANVRKGDRAADLGSGDGRIVIAFARAGAEAHGYEVNPLLVVWSWVNILRAGVAGRAFVHWGNFWRADFSRITVVTTFQVGTIMGTLEEKLRRELPDGARVLSHFWIFPNWRPTSTDNPVTLYVNKRPEEL